MHINDDKKSLLLSVPSEAGFFLLKRMFLPLYKAAGV
jgi:hypothetical protein